MGRLDASIAFLSRLAARFPNDPEIAIERAFSFESRLDLNEQIRCWEAVYARFPDHGIAHAGLGGSMRKAGRLDAAETVLAEAVRRFPGVHEVATEFAWVAFERGDLEESLARWQAVIARFPKNARGYAGASNALRRLLRFDEADALLASAIERFPAQVFVASDYATNADVRGDQAEAVRRWEVVRRSFPNAAIGYAGLGTALVRAKRFAEADAVFTAGMARFPDNLNLGVNDARAADFRQDWDEALRRWDAAAARFPTASIVKTGRAETIWHASLAAADKAATAAEGHHFDTAEGPAPVAARSRPTAALDATAMPGRYRDLLMNFEGLGDDCELGFVQRHFGAEPLGLLRWAGMPLHCLLEGLATGLDGVGVLDNTVLYVDPSTHEYWTRDTRFDMNMHTFIVEDKDNEKVIFDKLCRRVRYLRDKFIDDLRVAEKIFVFQSDDELTGEQMVELHAALRRYGDNTLLCVRPPDDGYSPGEVVTMADGLLVGYIDKPGFDGKRWDISFDLWLSICQKAERVWRERLCHGSTRGEDLPQN